jgi:hypothetical protein
MEKLNRNSYVYDIETLASCFTYVGINIDTNKIVKYVIHKDKFELLELIKHLGNCKGQIGFNNINFDYPVIHHILINWRKWVIKYNDKKELIINEIYEYAQKIINSKNDENSDFRVYIPLKDIKIPQLDLFKIWHYDNKAKSTSLKALQISMNFPNVMEMPIPHDKKDISLKEVEDILEYNLNDVLSTYEFYKKTVELGKIDLRKRIMSKFNLLCLNWNNGKIGENLVLKLYCEKTNLNRNYVKNLRTYRKVIHLKDCIPPVCNFKFKEFNEWINYIKNKSITQTKGSLEYSVIYKGHKYDMGLGGEHGFYKPGIYQSDDKYIIKSCDVSSLHPNLPLSFKFYIQHLGPEFLEVYGENIVKVRLNEKAKPKEQQDKTIIDGYKEAANIVYGKSNDVNSFLYDPLYTMKTTIASQVVISMLAERLADIPDSQVLMSNTDGLEIIIPKDYENLYYEICKNWEKETKLVLEFVNYEKIWCRDINNYGCITFNGKIKNKGCFEVDKVVGGEPAYHKDNSFRIVPLALQEYFVNDIPVEETIYKHDNIYDFCGRQNFKSDSIGEIHKIEYLNNKPILFIEKQQKNLRYYVSNDGNTLIKRYNDGTIENIHVKYKVTPYNKHIPKNIKEYNINYNFYIKECYKIINEVDIKQLTIF